MRIPFESNFHIRIIFECICINIRMKNPIIRTIYLYLFALIGLGMLVIGTSMIVNLGLKSWVFTKADSNESYLSRPMNIYAVNELNKANNLVTCQTLTKEEREVIGMWIQDYENWKVEEGNRDQDFYKTRDRQIQASTAFSMMLVGLPLWLFHWAIIKRDVKDNKTSQSTN